MLKIQTTFFHLFLATYKLQCKYKIHFTSFLNLRPSISKMHVKKIKNPNKDDEISNNPVSPIANKQIKHKKELEIHIS